MNESPYRVEDGDGLSSNFQTLENALKYDQWMKTRRGHLESKIIRVDDNKIWDHESEDWQEEIIPSATMSRKVKQLTLS